MTTREIARQLMLSEAPWVALGIAICLASATFSIWLISLLLNYAWKLA